jgi:predicted dehydrogenase
MINVGIIGCGSITRYRHAPEYAANEHAAIAGFFDLKKERATEMAAQFGGEVYNTVEAMLADESIAAVSVCVANRYHAQITIAALQAGKHVLCEKPMAASVADAQRMNAVAKETGKYLMIGHNQRLAEAHVKAKKILNSGEMGRILSFRTFFSHSGPEMWSADKSVNTWFFHKNDAIMGAMGDLGIHKADLIRWLIGDDITEVMAIVTTLDKKGPDGKLIDVDDNAICLLRSKSGIIGTLCAGWTNYGAEDNGTILHCSEGVMKIFDHPEYPIAITKKDGEKVYYRIGKIQTNENQTASGVIDLFVDGIVNDTPPEISGEEGLAALKIILACMESSRTGRKVRIPN